MDRCIDSRMCWYRFQPYWRHFQHCLQYPNHPNVSAHTCTVCVCWAALTAAPLLSVANPRAALTSGFITPATLHVTPGHNRGWEREPQLMAIWREGVLCSVRLCRELYYKSLKANTSNSNPQKAAVEEYKVLQGDLSSSKPPDWHCYCCALLGV